MSLIRWSEKRSWDPFRELDEMSNRLNRMFGRNELATRAEMETWAPSVNISENEKAYLVDAELPQVKKEDVKVELENGVLCIQGERKQEREDKTTKRHRVESFYGKFMRQFTLPEDVEPSRIEATFKDGMLHLTLPKSPTKSPQKTTVKIG